MTIPSLRVRPHTTAADLFVIYNVDGTEAGRGKLVTVPAVPEVGQFAPLFIQITDGPDELEPWEQGSPDMGDDLDTPARPA